MEPLGSTETQYAWHGVTWATGRPVLLLANTATGQLDHLQLQGREVGLKVASPARYCTGRYVFADTHHVEPVPCPRQVQAGTGGQCPACRASDEFRFAHHFHRGSHAPPALRAYMAQPHWLYIATFAHAVTKVGTAAAPRKESRLDEQGPLYATYLTESPDGSAVRRLEDTLSQELGVAQAGRGAAAKLAALAQPDTGRVRQAHDSVAGSAAAALARLGISPAQEEWSPPAESLALRSPQRHAQRAVYPHDLREGEHGFHIEACLGTSVLVRLIADTGPARYVLDLNALRSYRVILGDYTSPATPAQAALF
jgi:hypothetical protein